MTARTETLWTIDDLGVAVAAALSVGYEGQESGRVRDVPDRRTIRYYTTLGIIDRPAAMRGRTALYGERHLLQLVAIKRLQAEGRTLAEIQAMLAGMPVRALRKVAQLAEGLDLATPGGARAAPPPAAATSETERRGRAFWGAVPEDEAPDHAPRSEDRGPVMPQAGDHLGALRTALRLGDDISLLFSPSRAIDREDLEAIEQAAQPLLCLLHSRGLIERRTEESRG